MCVSCDMSNILYIREIDQREKMSNEEIEEKQYKYARKYKKMVKQFDELIDIVDSLTSKLRRGKNPRERKSACPVEASKSKAAAAADQTKEEEKSSSNPAGMILQEENDHNLLVQTVTRHLEDLRDDSP